MPGCLDGNMLWRVPTTKVVNMGAGADVTQRGTFGAASAFVQLG